MTNHITRWLKMEYDEKHKITMTNLVETTWLTRYPWTREITHGQESEYIVHELIKFLTEKEYRITAKPSSPGNPTSNVILEIIHSVLGSILWTYNIKYTYVYDHDPWSGSLSTANRLKCYNTGKFLFGRDMIIPIKNKVNWGLIRK